MTATSDKILRVGHSPDADDAYMFYALAKEAVTLPGYRIQHVIEDIQSLNQRALNADLEITAISAAVYPLVAKDYWILNSGSSVGRKYGPVLVAKKAQKLSDFKGKKIAVPGKFTTAFLLLQIFLDDFVAVQMDFKEVIGAVQNGTVEAGIVIHEGQLNFADFKLEKCEDLGELWHEKYNLPIPLGLDVVRKNLGRETAGKMQKALHESIVYARENEDGALEYAAQYGRGTVGKTLRDFVRMYVNEDTLDLGSEGKSALELLFKLGSEKKLFPAIPNIEIIY